MPMSRTRHDRAPRAPATPAADLGKRRRHLDDLILRARRKPALAAPGISILSPSGGGIAQAGPELLAGLKELCKPIAESGA